MKLEKFCFYFDLRRGTIVYAWLQMMFVAVVCAKLTWLQTVIKYNVYKLEFYYLLSYSMNIISTVQVIKGFTCLPLIWGAIKKKHQFYQPWLVINAFENILLIFLSIAIIIIGSSDPEYFLTLPELIILAVYGWYIWACIYIVYKNDSKPGLIVFNANYNNLSETVNITV